MYAATALSYAVGMVNGAEGFTARSFLDKLPKPPVWTIGHGTTRINGALITAGMTCTKAQADLWSMSDMTSAAHFVLSVAKVPLDAHQFAALISFCYNIGDGNFRDSTVLEALNASQFQIAADRLLDYDHAGGRRVKGLTLRRGRERVLFMTEMGLAPRPPTPIASAADNSADELNETELTRIKGESA